jgi:integrase
MPRLTRSFPKLCRHHRGQAFVKVDGQQIWLGQHGSPTARRAYDRLLAEWLAASRRLPPPRESAQQSEPSLNHVILVYWRWAKRRYTASERDTIRYALRVLRKLYGRTPVTEFGPNRLRAVRAEMVRIGWCRTHINKQISRIRSLFRWAASHELAPEAAYRRLATVEPLRRGEAKERPSIRPVPRSAIRRVRRHLSPQVRGLIDLQLLTGARAGELVGLRLSDLDRSSPVWVYRPKEHKNAHRGLNRTIYLGPRCQRIISIFTTETRAADAPIFSPREGNAFLKSRGAADGRRPNQRPNPRNSDRTIGNHYTTESYRRAIHRGCSRVGVPIWGPHRLRHNTATRLRRSYGIETARAVLGHRAPSTTEIYAELDHGRIQSLMAKVG